MTPTHEIERLLDVWLRDGPSHAPDRVMDAVADRIERQPQRPAWRIDWRHLTMTPTVKIAAEIAAVIVIAIVGWNLLPGGSANTGGPGTSASPAPSPSPTPAPSPSAPPFACEDDLPGCAGPLAAGTHATAQFQPAFSYETPESWQNVLDVSTVFKLDPVVSGPPYLIVWGNPAPAKETGSCDPTPRAGTSTVQQWIDTIRAHPGLVATTPTPVTIGGAKGQTIDVSVAHSWIKSCPDLPGFIVQFIVDTDPNGKYVYGVLSGDRMHLVILDVGGRTVIVQAYGPTDPAAFAASMASIQPIIDSMQFTPTN